MDTSPDGVITRDISFKTLEFRLQDIREGFETRAAEYGRAQTERFAAHQCLEAVIDFLHSDSSWRNAGLDFALVRLLSALTAVEQGTGDKMLERVREEGVTKPPIDVKYQVLQAKCAAILEILTEGGQKLEDASALMLRRLGADAVAWMQGAIYPTGPTARTIDRWRHIAYGAPRESLGWITYRETLEGFRQTCQGDRLKIERTAKKMLSRLGEEVAELGGPRFRRSKSGNPTS